MLYLEYMNSNAVRFDQGNRGTKACEFCGVLSWASRQDETANRAMCQGCYDSAGYANEHQDGYHTDRTESLCPMCNPEGEQKRLAKAAARVAAYQTVAAQRAAKAATKELTYPHCPHCGQRRPKTKQWEKTGIAGECSDCKDLRYWLSFWTNDMHNAEEAAKYQASLDRREGKYAR